MCYNNCNKWLACYTAISGGWEQLGELGNTCLADDYVQGLVRIRHDNLSPADEVAWGGVLGEWNWGTLLTKETLQVSLTLTVEEHGKSGLGVKELVDTTAWVATSTLELSEHIVGGMIDGVADVALGGSHHGRPRTISSGRPAKANGAAKGQRQPKKKTQKRSEREVEWAHGSDIERADNPMARPSGKISPRRSSMRLGDEGLSDEV